MVFGAGVLVGGVVGFGLAVVLTRRSRHASLAERRDFTLAVAVLALLVAAGALANSERRDRPSAARSTTAGAPSSTTIAVRLATTTTAATAKRTVTVPNVVGLARNIAVTQLQRVGLKASIESIALTNVPPGFVISQTPLPAGTTTLGTTVSLVVSSAA